MTYRDDNDALRQQVQELERELESARAEAAGRKEAEAEVERLKSALAEAQLELERLRPGAAQQAALRRRGAMLAGVGVAALLVVGAVAFLLVSRGGSEVAPASTPADQVAVVPSPGSTTGALPETERDERLVRSIIQQHAGEIRGCYEKELQASPGMAGTVTLQLAIDDGRVTPEIVAAGSTLNNAKVEACIVAAARRWSFPRDTRFTFRYPLVFRTSE
jgi:hypothetical protein